jgi:superfamily I DNA and/or RNA helicase
VMEELVAVLTPFKGQRPVLMNALRKAKIDVNKLKIGTVHVMQGAEREIVLFSTVYGDGDVSVMFFDRENKPNLLNVAVSRAKDSFIVMGNSRIFEQNASTPSAKLGRHLGRF